MRTRSGVPVYPTLAQLNYTLSVSEYVATNVKAYRLLNLSTKQIMAILWSLTCAAVILPLLQENNISNSTPHSEMSNKSS